MTKQDEKQILNTFIDGLPFDSYLYSIFSGIRLEITRAIDDDYGFIDWQKLAEDQVEQRASIKKLGEQIQQMRSEKVELEREIEKKSMLLDQIRREARRIAG